MKHKSRIFFCYPQWQDNGWTSLHSLGWSTASVLFGFAWVIHGQGSKIESVGEVEWVARERMDGLLIWSAACGPWLSAAGNDRLNHILDTAVCWQSLFLTPSQAWASVTNAGEDSYTHSQTLKSTFRLSCHISSSCNLLLLVIRCFMFHFTAVFPLYIRLSFSTGFALGPRFYACVFCYPKCMI